MERLPGTWRVFGVLCFATLLVGATLHGAEDEGGEGNFRVVQISDTQPGDEEGWRRAARSVALVNRLKPDFVFFAGDITSRGSEGEYTRMKELVDRIEAPLHVVPGNHDTIVPASTSEEAMSTEELRRGKLELYRRHFGSEVWSFEHGDYLFAGFDCTYLASGDPGWHGGENLTADLRIRLGRAE